MSEIAQADRDADLTEFMASDVACYLYPGEDQQAERAAYARGCADFARHRMEERAAIVAWLRKLSGYDATTPTFQDRRLAYQLAALEFSNAIEAGEHLK